MQIEKDCHSASLLILVKHETSSTFLGFFSISLMYGLDNHSISGTGMAHMSTCIIVVWFYGNQQTVPSVSTMTVLPNLGQQANDKF